MNAFKTPLSNYLITSALSISNLFSPIPVAVRITTDNEKGFNKHNFEYLKKPKKHAQVNYVALKVPEHRVLQFGTENCLCFICNQGDFRDNGCYQSQWLLTHTAV